MTTEAEIKNFLLSPLEYIKMIPIGCNLSEVVLLNLQSGVTFRYLRTKDPEFLAGARSLYHLFTKAFANNWSSTPRNEEEFLEEA